MSTRILLMACVCAVTTPLLSQAAVVNGGFETGDLTGWTVVGSAQAPDATIGVTPTHGTRQGYIETTGNYTAYAMPIEDALGIPETTFTDLGAGTPVNGTAITQSVTVSAGDTLTFDWDFLTDELDEDPMYNDFAYLIIDNSVSLLASRNGSAYDTVSPPAGFDGQTDWMSGSYTFTSAGTHTIGFGVFNVGDTGHNSVLLLDAIALPVPEPATGVLLAIGLALVVAQRWRPRIRAVCADEPLADRFHDLKMSSIAATQAGASTMQNRHASTEQRVPGRIGTHHPARGASGSRPTASPSAQSVHQFQQQMHHHRVAPHALTLGGRRPQRRFPRETSTQRISLRCRRTSRGLDATAPVGQNRQSAHPSVGS